MVDQAFNERYICGQWSDQNDLRDFHLGFYAIDEGNSCSAVVNKAWIFYSNQINFIPLNEKQPYDGKISKIEAKEKIDEILKTHSVIRKKKKMIQKAKFGS